jgi:hypothetical protein
MLNFNKLKITGASLKIFVQKKMKKNEKKFVGLKILL